MSKGNLYYSILQYSARPERFEFVNLGVFVFDREQQRVHRKLSANFDRVKKLFGDASPSFLEMALEDYSERVEYEYIRSGLCLSAEEFNSKRAGIFQITPILPIVGENSSEVVDNLFSDLVESRIRPARAQKVSTLLTNALQGAGVLPLLQKRPKPVVIEKWGVSVKADFGYQNGTFNLIDSARFDDSERGLAEAGKRVLEGSALAETLEHRLIVVGAFGDQPQKFVDDMKNEFAAAKTKLFSLSEVNLLADDIRRAAH